MATIYSHNANDKVLILDPREAFQRKLDLGSWNEIRIGMFYNTVGLNTPTSSYLDETVVQNTRSDIIAVGLKDSATSILPGFSGSYYIGMALTGSHNIIAQNTSYYDTSGDPKFNGGGFYGTSSYWGAQSLSYLGYPTNGGGNNATDYCFYYVLKMVLNNSGSASQTISMYASNSSYASGTTYYSVPILNQQINNATFGTVSTVAWNDGASALPIPDSLWIRTPFYFNRLRISSLSVIKYS